MVPFILGTWFIQRRYRTCKKHPKLDAFTVPPATPIQMYSKFQAVQIEYTTARSTVEYGSADERYVLENLRSISCLGLPRFAIGRARDASRPDLARELRPACLLPGFPALTYCTVLMRAVGYPQQSIALNGVGSSAKFFWEMIHKRWFINFLLEVALGKPCWMEKCWQSIRQKGRNAFGTCSKTERRNPREGVHTVLREAYGAAINATLREKRSWL